MANLFVTDKPTSATNIGKDYIDNILPDLDVCLKHPRVTKITMNADGSMTIDLKDEVVAGPSEIIRKKEGLHKANKTGFRGVSIRGNKYRADISEDGVQYNLGSFETFGEAVAARLKAEMGLI